MVSTEVLHFILSIAEVYTYPDPELHHKVSYETLRPMKLLILPISDRPCTLEAVLLSGASQVLSPV